jgi:hypothetical protein
VSLPLAVSAGDLSDMDAGWAAILAAVVAAVGGVIVAAIQRARSQDSEEHGLVMDMMRVMHQSQVRTETKLDRVDERLSSHLQFHADQERMLDNAGHVHQNGTASNSKVSKKGVSRRR